MSIFDFFTREAGQERRRALEGLLTQFIPPEMRPQLGLLAEANPVVSMERAGQDAQQLFAPDQSLMDRLAAGGRMASNMAAVAAPAMVASRAALPAAQALQEGLTGVSTAVQPFMVDEFGGVSLNPYERIALSTPASWRDPKYSKPQWHPISDTSMAIPANEVRPIVEQLGVLEPERAMRIEDLAGRVLTPAFGDRTIAGVNIRGFDDVNFDAPIRSQGGRDFMRETGTGLWASELTPMSRKAKAVRGLLDAGEEVSMPYTAMGAQSGDFSTIMRDTALASFDPTKITDDAAKKFDDRMVALGIKGWPGTKSGKVQEALNNMPGSTRWAVWQEMDKAGYRDAGFPDIGRTRVAITDPELLNVDPFTTGLSVGRPNTVLTNQDFTPHPSYEWQLGGQYEGSLGNLPGQLIWRDFFEKRRSAGAAPAGDQRAFMMGSPEMTQRVDQQMIDEVNEWLERQARGQ